MHALVLDANGMPHIDYTGTQTLAELTTELRQQGITTSIAWSSHVVHRDLKHSGLLKDIGPGNLFATVEEAVSAQARDP